METLFIVFVFSFGFCSGLFVGALLNMRVETKEIVAEKKAPDKGSGLR